MAGINMYFTVVDAIYDCGVTDDALFNGNTKSDRMADELFDYDLLSCLDKTYKEFNGDLKSESNLTVVNRQIRLGSGKKKDIKDCIKWTRDQIRLGLNPSLTRFPAVNTLDYINRYKHHSDYIKSQRQLRRQRSRNI